MEQLILEATLNSPEIKINTQALELSIKGVCAPENPRTFFNELLDKCQTLIHTPELVTITIQLDYFNTGSSRSLLDLLLLRGQSDTLNSKTKVIWTVENGDEDLLESGKIMEELSGLPFVFQSI